MLICDIHRGAPVVTHRAARGVVQNPDKVDLIQASRYFKKSLECPYDAARAITKLQAIWNILMQQPKPPAFVYADIAHVS